MRTASRPSKAAPGRRPARRKRTHRRPVKLAVLAAAAVVLGVLVAAPVLAARDARTDLLAGEAQLRQARDALSGADLEAAREAFAAAAQRIAEGRARLDRPALRWLGALPVAGDNLAVARALARAGGHVAAAGLTATDAIVGLPGGLAALAPRDGAVPLDPLRSLADPLAEAARELAAAEEAIAAAPDHRLAGPLARARAQAVTQVDEASQTLRTGAALAGALPTFLGGDGPRRYFVGAQNPAELRGTGGLIGAFGILTVEGGRIDISEFRNISELTRAAPAELPPPSEDYAARYARYSAGVHGSNINMTPDVPTAATAIETLYEAVTGETVDGTILADPLLLRALLEVVGPTDVPEIGTVDASSVVRFVTQEQYALFPGSSDERKEALGEIAGAVLRRFLTEGPWDPRAALGALGAAAADGRLRLHARDETVQAAFAQAGLDGAMADPQGDYLAVVGNNAAGNKADAFLEREISYDVTLQPDGKARGHLTVTLTNTAPTSGLHSTVIGPYHDDFTAGENHTLWSVYCAPGCKLTAFRRDGQADLVASERELGRPVFTTSVRLASGASQVLEFAWTVPDAWGPGERGRTYHLDVDAQPALLASSATRVRVEPPEGARITATDPPIAIHGQRAVWSADGLVGSFGVEFTGSGGGFPRRAREVLNRPLIPLDARP